nr:MAG TPA: hypothetical protein [Caudoviricetes sp.]
MSRRFDIGYCKHPHSFFTPVVVNSTRDVLPTCKW